MGRLYSLVLEYSFFNYVESLRNVSSLCCSHSVPVSVHYCNLNSNLDGEGVRLQHEAGWLCPKEHVVCSYSVRVCVNND